MSKLREAVLLCLRHDLSQTRLLCGQRDLPFAGNAASTRSMSNLFSSTSTSCFGQQASCIPQTFQARQLSSSSERGEGRGNKKILDTAMYLTAVVVGMVGLSYASVPLYRMFCQATGYGGTVRVGKSVEDKIRERIDNPNDERERKAAERDITIWFTSEVAEGMPWRFRPTQDWVTIKPGQSTLAFYTAENLSDKPITGVATYNVVPDKAGYYFNKIQCFCFEEQRLRPREVVDMPVFFYIDPEIVDDKNCKNVRDITLSYTFFKSEAEEEEGGEEVQGGVKLHGSGVVPAGITGVVPSTVAKGAS